MQHSVKDEEVRKLTIFEAAKAVNTADIARRYVKLRPYGKSFKGSCPFHKEKTPSFYVYPSGCWICYGCGVKGSDATSFLAELKGMRQKEAAEILAKEFGLAHEGQGLPRGRSFNFVKTVESTDYEHLGYIELFKAVNEALRAYKNPESQDARFYSLLELRQSLDILSDSSTYE